MAKIDDLPDLQVESRAAWREWLRVNGDKSDGVWLVTYKKSSGKPRVTYDEAVEEALCFGWIDSLPRRLDEERSKLLMTPRKTGSVWSKLNKTRVEKLTESGAIMRAGAKKIEAAQRDGSWDALNQSDALIIAADLTAAFQANPVARAHFEAWSDAVRRNILEWIYAAKGAATRRARIAKAVRMAAKNLRANFDKEI